jgi:hypothetical protein
MKTWALWLACIGSSIALAEEIPPAVKVVEAPASTDPSALERVRSSSEQFTISGGDGAIRSIAAALAEESKNELLRLTEEKEEWKVPIRLVLHGKKGDPAPPRSMAMAIHLTDIGYEVRLDLHLANGLDKEPYKSLITSALIYERSLRDRPREESDTPLTVPAWLVTGLQEATAWRLNQSDRKLYEALYKMGGYYKMDELFAVTSVNAEEMDAATRAAFRASSGALVMALLQQPQGKEGFRTFLTKVAAYEGEMPSLLRLHFPELNLSENSLAKWWALQMANIGGQNLLSDVLTIAQTEATLAEALKLNFRTSEGILESKDLAAWTEVAALPAPERAGTVKLAQEALVRLSYRCFPSYRPILSEYQLILNRIAKSEIKTVAADLTALQERRTTMTAKAVRARDYLIWFEMTRARDISGDFDSFIRLHEKLKVTPRQRNDSLSKYLDQMDAIFDRGQVPTTERLPVESLLPELPPQ